MSFCRTEENRGLTAFAKAMGFDLSFIGTQYSISVGEFLRSATCHRLILGQEGRGILALDEVRGAERNQWINYLVDRGLTADGWYDPSLSSISLRDRRISSVMLVQRMDRVISLLWIHSLKKGIFPETIQHLRRLVAQLQREYSDLSDLTLRFMVEDEDMVQFASDLCGGSRHLKTEGEILRAFKLLESATES